jgi:adenylate kinase family enzyme
MPRIHILGASGSGTSTLGEAIANELVAQHFDTDDFYWLPTNPPFTTPRPAAERLDLLGKTLATHPSWVLSGSALKWGDPLVPFYDFIVFLSLNPILRMERLRVRERARYGHRIESGGDMVEASAAFLTWAAAYDTAGLEPRSRVAHEAWLAVRTVPVLRLDSSAPLETLTAAVLSFVRTTVQA